MSEYASLPYDSKTVMRLIGGMPVYPVRGELTFIASGIEHPWRGDAQLQEFLAKCRDRGVVPASQAWAYHLDAQTFVPKLHTFYTERHECGERAHPYDVELQRLALQGGRTHAHAFSYEGAWWAIDLLMDKVVPYLDDYVLGEFDLWLEQHEHDGGDYGIGGSVPGARVRRSCGSLIELSLGDLHGKTRDDVIDWFK